MRVNPGDKPIRGVNFIAIFLARDVTTEELQQYINRILTADAGDRPEHEEADFAFGSTPKLIRNKPWWRFW
jgi:hypothetical protein